MDGLRLIESNNRSAGTARLPNNSMQRTVLRAAADAERCAKSMKHLALALAYLSLFSCTSSSVRNSPTASSVEGCCLEAYTTLFTTPNFGGLISMASQEAAPLLSQLPADARHINFCWYLLPSGNLEARYGYARTAFVSAANAPRAGAYVFERRDNHWQFVTVREIQLLEVD